MTPLLFLLLDDDVAVRPRIARPRPVGLGVGRYRAEVRRLAPDGSTADIIDIPIADTDRVQWGRRLAATSSARVSVYGLPDDVTTAVRTIGHELALYRNNELAWSGPIATTDAAGSVFTIDARDVSWWLRGRPTRRVRRGVVDLAVAFRNLLDDCHPGRSYEAAAPDACGIRGEVAYDPTERRMGDEVLATLVDLGLEWTAIGNRIVAGATVGGGTERTLRFPKLDERDFLAGLRVIERGDLAATDVVAVGGSGPGGRREFAVASADGVDEAFRVWKRLNLPRVTTKRDLQRRADDELAARWPPPVVVTVPDGSALAATAPAQMGHLIPGAHGVVEVARASVAAWMKLTTVAVERAGDTGEKVTVTLVPGSAVLA